VKPIDFKTGSIYLFLLHIEAGVCKRWAQLYKVVFPREAAKTTFTADIVSVSYRRDVVPAQPATRTTYKAAYASPARAALAADTNLVLSVNAVIYHAGKHASNSTLQRLLKLGLPKSQKLSQGVAASGCVDVLTWLCDTKMCSVSAYAAAVAAFDVGNLPVLQWAHQRGGITALRNAQRQSLFKAAGKGGHVQLLAWCRATAALWPTSFEERCLLITAAAEHNRLSLLKWLHAIGYALQRISGALLKAAANSHYEVFRFLYENGCSLGVQDPQDSPDAHAALAGNLIILRYIRQRQPQRWTAQLLSHMVWCAGMAGHAHVVEYLRKYRAPWPTKLWHADVEDPESPAVGIKSSCWALPALQYAVTAGCPWGAWRFGLCCELIACGYEAEVKWGHKNGCPCGTDCPAR
jgi:hypothetical protein